MPEVTVLMAVYNGEPYLREAIDSILNQSFRDFEFLIINDGSTDRTREIIVSYDDMRIRLVDNDKNLGLTKSLNKGLKLATGQLVARQDADDISEPERLAKQVSFLERHRTVALLGSWYKEIDAQGTLTGYRTLPCDFTEIRWCLLFFCPFVHSAVMLRKSSVLEQIGLYNEALAYSQDYELWSRIARSLPVANLNEYLVQLRTTQHSMTATYGESTQEGRLIRIATMAALLRWDQTSTAANGSKFDLLYSFLYGTPTDFTRQEVQRCLEEILRLQSAFCRHYRMAPANSRSHRAALHAELGSRLIGVARHSFARGNYTDALLYLARACRLYMPTW